MQVIADGRNSNTAGTAMGYLQAVINAFNAQWQADHGVSAPPLQVVGRAWYNPSLETRWFMVPALIGTLTMLQPSSSRPTPSIPTPIGKPPDEL